MSLRQRLRSLSIGHGTINALGGATGGAVNGAITDAMAHDLLHAAAYAMFALAAGTATFWLATRPPPPMPKSTATLHFLNTRATLDRLHF
jgi:hypothetical protein